MTSKGGDFVTRLQGEPIMRCRRSPAKKHFGKGEIKEAGRKSKRKKGYTFHRYGPGNKGHSWRLHGKERICVRCRYKPSIGRRISEAELEKILKNLEEQEKSYFLIFYIKRTKNYLNGLLICVYCGNIGEFRKT